MSVAAETYAYHAEGRAAGRPLVFAFHGTGGTENQFVPLVRELVPGAAIVAPRGDVSRARRAALLPPHRRGRLRHGRSRAADRGDGGLRRGACRGGAAVAR